MAQHTILVVGAGGREHALAWALAQSPAVAQIFVAPGNAGTASGRASNVPIAAEDVPALLQFAQQQQVDLTVVGPEAVLAAGIGDAFHAAGLRIFGPTRAASRLETSKVFAKAFMQQHTIPTAAYAAFDSYEAAHHHLRAQYQTNPRPLVVKADGLAAGKGVMVCESSAAAEAALQRIMHERAFGAAGDQVIIEECLSGPEVSLLAFSDGKTLLTMPPARDHKRAYEGDSGPNTGGMGAYAPAPDVAAGLVASIERTVLQPVLQGMAAQGTPYVGMLYAGLMLTPHGPQVLEFNCRFGDPEAQALLPLLVQGTHGTLASATLLDILLACVEGRLDEVQAAWHPGACATVVLASGGYPDAYPKGIPIGGLEHLAHQDDVMVFHAGTALQDGRLVTSGGRVLAVSALGADLPAALNRAYAGIAHIHFEGMHYRRDIGYHHHPPATGA